MRLFNLHVGLLLKVEQGAVVWVASRVHIGGGVGSGAQGLYLEVLCCLALGGEAIRELKCLSRALLAIDFLGSHGACLLLAIRLSLRQLFALESRVVDLELGGQLLSSGNPLLLEAARERLRVLLYLLLLFLFNLLDQRDLRPLVHGQLLELVLDHHIACVCNLVELVKDAASLPFLVCRTLLFDDLELFFVGGAV